MKRYKKIIAKMLVLLMVCTTVSSKAYAKEANTMKEEVVYVNLDYDGSVKEIHVVNIFDLDEEGRIIDYGAYETLRNMTTTDEIGYEENTVTVEKVKGKLYYEGKLKNTAIPWDMSIHYYLDGEEYQGDELAGKSGVLRIAISVRKNEECKSNFFEGYALQATMTLDSSNCKNILADGATVANVGNDKQITYTILPDKETDIEIIADVIDFEMNAIQINGVSLNLSVEVDDSELQDKIGKVIDAITELDNGGNELYEGAKKLQDATGTLNDKMGELHSGVGELESGSEELYTGLKSITSKNNELTGSARTVYEALCTSIETQLNAQLKEKGFSTVTLTPDNYEKVLMNLIKKMDADAIYQQAYATALKQVTAQVEKKQDELYKGYIQSQADTIYLTYMQSQADLLYQKVATQTVIETLVKAGYTLEEAQNYVQTPEGQILVSEVLSAMTDEQKEQIVSGAVASLTGEQKKQILNGVLSSLTKKQKEEIKNGYVKEMMADKTVTNQISKAVKEANKSAAQIVELKGQLDNYGAFYQGIVSYTSAVSQVANGANKLHTGLDTLYGNTDTLKNAVGDLDNAMGDLCDGTKELTEGTGEFAKETEGMETKVEDEIDEMVSSVSGKDVEVVSFVSEKNTNIKSVQFVMKTDNIASEVEEATKETEEEQLSFGQKLLRLFGI